MNPSCSRPDSSPASFSGLGVAGGGNGAPGAGGFDFGFGGGYLAEQGRLKRVLDLAGALAALFFTAPLALLAGLLLYRESHGSIFIRETRVGRGGRPFALHTFRPSQPSSRGHESAARTHRFSIADTFIRFCHIGALPQLWNVLKGDMSLVGPQPERPSDVEEAERAIPGYAQRLRIKPGMTGWAQLESRASGEHQDLQTRFRSDLAYLGKASIGFDLAILVRTLLGRDAAAR